ncbi:bifunctional 5,10-methylenetetrahydrofolate dehydrogenase/5,10-methenyltetrahydrofolate cyclohydrolase [candidate division KSB1 bacterium]|nr:bifunctional 5,10-methylenetetrahydrofolate dehydrogenase/5,10-methenyltetrahydrofolate cyclohydrolase [candidate division KSB1 bacterium]
MIAEIIDGKKIAGGIKKEVNAGVSRLKERGISPKLVAILVGEHPASATYVRMKKKACAEVGIQSEVIQLPVETPQNELKNTIQRLNADKTVHGILVQLPLPSPINTGEILQFVSPEKDVDGFHPLNVGKMILDGDGFLPCTAAGIRELLLRSGHAPDGKHVVVLGRSQIVGRPLAHLLSQKKKGANATVTLCHSQTHSISFFTRQADILVAAMGKPEFITGEMVKKGAVVIDVGVNRVADSSREKGYRLVGDVHFPSVTKVAGSITPVPGGVGPMTIVMLLKNTLRAAELSAAV